MKTDVIKIDSKLNGSDQALEAVEKFSAYNGVSGKGAMHLRLLTEDTISMIHGIMDDFSGDFWLESENTASGVLCRICISVPRAVDCSQEEHFMDVSTSRKNLNAKGFMGKIREFIRLTLQPVSPEDVNNQGTVADNWWLMGSRASAAAPDPHFWSMQLYRQSVSENKDANQEEWDELEKSIVAKLADEVKIWLSSDSTQIAVEKKVRI